MVQPSVGLRSEEISDTEQGRLCIATAAYFEALPRLHQELIGELSACRQVNPVALIGQALADGLERMMNEVRYTTGDNRRVRPIDMPQTQAVRHRIDTLSTRKVG